MTSTQLNVCELSAPNWNFLRPACESPPWEGWRAGEVLRRLHAVAQRRGGFFVTRTHPEAFGFCPSQEGTWPHSSFTADLLTRAATCSARTLRLIFIDAVRGKSSSQSTYPLKRLKSASERFRDRRSCRSPSAISAPGSSRNTIINCSPARDRCFQT